MIADETPAHSPVRLLQKLAAYRALIASPEPQRKPSILAESTNFFSRLWRPSTTQQRTPSPVLLASHEMNSTSFDHISDSIPTPPEALPPSISSPIVNRRMSLIREVSSKSSVNQNPSQSSSSSIVVPLSMSAVMETQVRQSSTMTDPSFEDTTSEQPYDTASEFFSQSLDTNIDSSNPGIVGDGEDADDADDKRASFQTPLTYDERHRRLSLSGKSPRPSIPQLSSLPTQIIEQPHSDNQASPETSIDLSNVS